MSEVAIKGRRGLFSSLQYMTIVGGQLLALIVVIILQAALTSEELSTWGWRIPFALGALGAVVVLALRRGMVETATSESMHSRDAGSLRLMLRHKRAVVLVLCFTMGGSLYFYTFTTYMQKFLVVSDVATPQAASLLMGFALFLFMLMQPVFGLLSDCIGVRANMRIFCILAVFGVVPILAGIQASQSLYAAFAMVIFGLATLAFYTPIAGIIKADLFPIEVRALGVGLPYAVANAVFGGTAEYIALRLGAEGIGDLYFYYVMGVVAISLVASFAMPDLARHGYLEGDGQVEKLTKLRFLKTR